MEIPKLEDKILTLLESVCPHEKRDSEIIVAHIGSNIVASYNELKDSKIVEKASIILKNILPEQCRYQIPPFVTTLEKVKKGIADSDKTLIFRPFSSKEYEQINLTVEEFCGLKSENSELTYISVSGGKERARVPTDYLNWAKECFKKALEPKENLTILISDEGLRIGFNNPCGTYYLYKI